jgi:anti-sigma factor RsiW
VTRRPRRVAATAARSGVRHGPRHCRDLVRFLSDYVDGALGRALRRSIDRHGGGCPPCRAFVRTLAATVRAVRLLPRRPLSRARRAALVAALRRARSTRPARGPAGKTRSSPGRL